MKNTQQVEPWRRRAAAGDQMVPPHPQLAAGTRGLTALPKAGPDCRYEWSIVTP